MSNGFVPFNYKIVRYEVGDEVSYIEIVKYYRSLMPRYENHKEELYNWLVSLSDEVLHTMKLAKVVDDDYLCNVVYHKICVQTARRGTDGYTIVAKRTEPNTVTQYFLEDI